MGRQGPERRRLERFDLPATAMLVQRGGSVGRFTVQNLSAGGALLTGGHDVRASAPLRVFLELPGMEPLTLGAHVKRRVVHGNLVALAVAFRHISESSEDRIQDALLELLAAAHREEHPAVLVVDPSPDARAELAATIRALDRRVLTAEAPLGALCVLDDPDERVDAVVVRLGDENAPVELLEHVAESYPRVRPILYVADRISDPPVAHPRVQRCGPEHLAEVLARR
ncbi:MAG TPA: PilZ domain-containing protein [Sandaracinaceae bacterium]